METEIERIKREIKHAFDDACMNLDGETDRENRKKFREMLEMHVDIIREFHSISEDELKSLVIDVAKEIGVEQDYRWAYRIASQDITQQRRKELIFLARKMSDDAAISLFDRLTRKMREHVLKWAEGRDYKTAGELIINCGDIDLVLLEQAEIEIDSFLDANAPEGLTEGERQIFLDEWDEYGSWDMAGREILRDLWPVPISEIVKEYKEEQNGG
jgi:hypothetical protein